MSYLFYLLLILLCTFASFDECPNNCICYEDNTLVCHSAELPDVLAYMEDRYFVAVAIRNTPIYHLSKLPPMVAKIMDITNCQIETIEIDAFENVNHLLHLILDNNFLKVVPQLGYLRTWESFSAKYNMISKIDTNLFSRSKNIAKIDLSHNLLNETDFLKPVKNTLRGLALHNNLFQYIEISNFTELVILRLEHNLLRRKSSVNLSNLPMMDKLALDENGISFLEVMNITNVPKLMLLVLRHNLLGSTTKHNFTKFTSIKQLDLSFNSLQMLPEIPTTMESIWLNNNEFNGAQLVFPKSNLKSVNLNGNNMKVINMNIFKNLEHLEVVDIGDNGLLTGQPLLLPLDVSFVRRDIVKLSAGLTHA